MHLPRSSFLNPSSVIKADATKVIDLRQNITCEYPAYRARKVIHFKMLYREFDILTK